MMAAATASQPLRVLSMDSIQAGLDCMDRDSRLRLCCTFGMAPVDLTKTTLANTFVFILDGYVSPIDICCDWQSCKFLSAVFLTSISPIIIDIKFPSETRIFFGDLYVIIVG